VYRSSGHTLRGWHAREAAVFLTTTDHPPGNRSSRALQVNPMFAAFLLALVLSTSLIMLVLLVVPTHDPPRRRDRLPVVGVLILLLFALLAILGGYAVTS
jgi:hypothetical protein